MSEKHLAERLMYPLPDGWRDDPEQVAALKEIWPKIIAKNKELIDAEITSLRAQLDEARADAERLHVEVQHFARLAFDDPGKNPPRAWKDIADEARRTAIEDAAQVAGEYALKVRSLMRGVPSVEECTAQSIAKLTRALLSESKS